MYIHHLGSTEYLYYLQASQTNFEEVSIKRKFLKNSDSAGGKKVHKVLHGAGNIFTMFALGK